MSATLEHRLAVEQSNLAVIERALHRPQGWTVQSTFERVPAAVVEIDRGIEFQFTLHHISTEVTITLSHYGTMLRVATWNFPDLKVPSDGLALSWSISISGGEHIPID